jgi:hypothetical protein
MSCFGETLEEGRSIARTHWPSPEEAPVQAERRHTLQMTTDLLWSPRVSRSLMRKEDGTCPADCPPPRRC